MISLLPSKLLRYTYLVTGYETNITQLTAWKYHGEPTLLLPLPVPYLPEHIDMDAFFEDISANNVPTQTTGPQPAQTTGPNNEFEEFLQRPTQKLNREDNLKMPNCPVCKASRYKDPKKTKGKSPAKDIDVYLQPLIKELQELWKGVWMKDAATGTHF
ncbi:hypothetical protein Tco_0232374 [Tanacetum coccineum]